MLKPEPTGKDTLNLPFKLETTLECAIAADPEWLIGLEWGQSRPGHPEGKVIFHIQNVLNNIDRFFGHSNSRLSLRLIALIHDTFKYKSTYRPSSALQKSHGFWAREFAKKYIDDAAILQVIEQHDDAYKASRWMTEEGNPAAAEMRAQALIAQLGGHLDLFMRFYLCDNRTADKSSEHYRWFERLVNQSKVVPSSREPGAYL